MICDMIKPFPKNDRITIVWWFACHYNFDFVVLQKALKSDAFINCPWRVFGWCKYLTFFPTGKDMPFTFLLPTDDNCDKKRRKSVCLMSGRWRASWLTFPSQAVCFILCWPTYGASLLYSLMKPRIIIKKKVIWLSFLEFLKKFRNKFFFLQFTLWWVISKLWQDKSQQLGCKGGDLYVTVIVTSFYYFERNNNLLLFMKSVWTKKEY